MTLKSFYNTLDAPYVRLSDTKSSGTAGTTYSLGAYRVVTINTEEQDAEGICSVSSNQFTLDAGTYSVEINYQSPINLIANYTARLRSAGGTTILKWSARNTSRDTNNSWSLRGEPIPFSGRFTLAAQTAIELQVFSSANWTQAALSDGENEVYWTVELVKLA